MEEIPNFSVVKQYRYLGILINNWLNPIGWLKETSKKIEVYIKRNRWLLKRYFKGTPESRFMLAKANDSFRNTMMIRLIKVIKK